MKNMLRTLLNKVFNFFRSDQQERSDKEFHIYQSTFHPENLQGKSNYKKYYSIYEDGKIVERVLLSILDPTHREEIIFLHYMRNQVRIFYQDTVGVNVISRDNPWDYKIELSNGLKFNLEITSIADDKDVFRRISNEERHTKNRLDELTTLRELKKIDSKFSNEPESNIIKKIEEDGIGLDDEIPNPFYMENENIYFSTRGNNHKKLSDLIIEAIDKKLKKKHSEKEETIIVIDNRTIRYELNDLEEAVFEMKDYLESLVFKEVWFYTGYCSDNNGNNAEYSFLDLKISPKRKEKLIQSLSNNDRDDLGVFQI